MKEDQVMGGAPATRSGVLRRLFRMVFRLLRALFFLGILAIAALWGYCCGMEYLLEKQLYVFWAEKSFSIDRVSFSPWTHEFTLYNLCWRNPPGYTPGRKAIEIQRVQADLELADLCHGILHFKNFEISGIHLSLEFKTHSLLSLSKLLDDKAPEVNLYEAIQLQFTDEADVPEKKPSTLFRTVRIDTLTIGESMVTFANIENIPGLNLVLNLHDCFAVQLPPYHRYGVGFEQEMTHEEVLTEIINIHCRKVQELLAHRLLPTDDTLERFYRELFSDKLCECEKSFEEIRDWEGLLKASQSMDTLEDDQKLLKALDNFLKHYPYTQVVIRDLRELQKARAAGVITAEELHEKQDLLRRSRNASEAIKEWEPHDWWKFWE